jgi:sulfite exporter TauE/SafE
MFGMLSAALIMGTGTIMSCAALCLPLVLPYTASSDRPGLISGLTPAVSFSVGRLMSYLALMLVLFFLKSTLKESFFTIAVIDIFSGLVAITSGFMTMGAFSSYPAFNKHFCFMFTGTGSPFILGVLAGISPCAPLFAALAFALTLSSLAKMSLFIACFWLASTALIILLSSMSGGLASVIGRRIGLERVRRIAGIAIIFIGLVLLIRGFGNL